MSENNKKLKINLQKFLNFRSSNDYLNSLIVIVLESFTDVFLVFKYIVTGVTGILVNLIALYVLTEFLGLWYIFSAITSFVLSFITAFILQKYWTFSGATHNTTYYQAKNYFLVAIGGMVTNIVLLYIAVDILGLWYFLSQIVILGFIAFVSFLINKNITFGKSK
jgi:dolichol-phosphate mannosyltransferase